MEKNKFYIIITLIACIFLQNISLEARGGGGHGGHSRHGGGGRGRGGHGYSRRGGYGHGGYHRGGWGYGGYGGFGWGLGLGFALGYPGYWSNGYYYNSQPIIIDNSSYAAGQACWNDEIGQWVLCNTIIE